MLLRGFYEVDGEILGSESYRGGRKLIKNKKDLGGFGVRGFGIWL